MTTLRYWEDFSEGDTMELGRRFISKDEIIEFGTKYDPLDIHVCEEKAKQTPLGQLCASGIHTIAVAQRIQAESLFSKVAVVAGTRLTNLLLRKPVTPDQYLSLSVEILNCVPSLLRGDRGEVEYLLRVKDEAGDIVASYEITCLVQRRPGA